MIDPQARVEMLDEQGRDPAVAVVLLDVVLGLGSHEDPAGQLAPACARAVQQGAAVVAYVLGTDHDPQGYARQREILAGCRLPRDRDRRPRRACRRRDRRPRPRSRHEDVMSAEEIALVTYSTKPRGGVVHTLSLAEALTAAGRSGTHRDARRAGLRLLPSHDRPVHGRARPTVRRTPSNSAYSTRSTRSRGDCARSATGSRSYTRQDCISARAAARVRDAGFGPRVLRTVHHIDDFTTTGTDRLPAPGRPRT